MGNSLEQWRAAIGGFSSGTKKRCGTCREHCTLDKLDEENHTFNSQHPTGWARTVLSWKVAVPTLLLLLLSALCQADILIIGGVEANPGPPVLIEDSREVRENLLAAIASKAALSCNETRDVIRAYNLDYSTKQLKTALNQFNKPQLVKCAKWLNIDDPDGYTKPGIVNNIIIAIQALFPSKCGMCEKSYTFAHGDQPLLECSNCRQGIHSQCTVDRLAPVIELLGYDANALTPTILREVLHLDHISGLTYLCSVCHAASIPNKTKGKLKVKKGTGKKSQPSPDAEAVPLASNDAANAAGEEEDEEATDEAAVEFPSARVPRKSGEGTLNPPKKKLDPAKDTRPVCRFYKQGTCRHGKAGKGCQFYHPNKKCPVLLQHGNRGPKGCTKGEKCEYFHPKMCQKSVETRTCAVQDCKLQHVAGTNRAVTGVSTSEPTDLPSKTTAQIKSNKKGSNNKKQPQTQVQNSFLDERLAMMEEQIKNLSSMETRIMEAILAKQATNSPPQQAPTLLYAPQSAMPYRGAAMPYRMQQPYHPLQAVAPQAMAAAPTQRVT